MTEINFKKKIWRVEEPEENPAKTIEIKDENIANKPNIVESAPVNRIYEFNGIKFKQRPSQMTLVRI